tara:strand:+ start:5597 stop:5878 length:282 start_codon:yes stop_codon:yes gene_type:complete
MSTDEEIIQDILSNSDKRSKTQFQHTYPEFFRRCPVLSEKLFDPNMDQSMLRYMLKQKQQIMEQGVTEHEASVNVGHRLVNQYVKPLINSETN